MAIRVKNAGTWGTAIAVRPKIGGSWKTMVGVFIKTGGIWKLVLGTGTGGASLTLTQTVSSVSGSRSGAGAVTSSAATGIRTNGTAAFTFAWSRISGDTFTINTPTAISTTFSATLLAGDNKSGVYRLTVTDSLGATASADVTVNLTASSGGGSPPSPPGYAPLTVAISPAGATNTTYGSANLNVIGVTAIVSGGSGSYSYSWSGDYASISNPTGASTNLSVNLYGDDSKVSHNTVSVNSTDGQSASDTKTFTFNNVAPAPPPPSPPPPSPPPPTPPTPPGPSPLSASASGSCYGFTHGTSCSTNTVSISVSGGVPPYGYSWSSGGSITASAGGSSVSFSKSVGTPVDAYFTGSANCHVTDSVGASVDVGVDGACEFATFS